MAKIETVDNFNSDYIKNEPNGDKNFVIGESKYKCEGKNLNKGYFPINLTLADFLKKSPDNTLIPIIPHLKVKKREEDEFIISINREDLEDNKYKFNVRTGNYIGKITWKNVDIEIGSRFSEVLLNRMLNVADDIFLSDVTIKVQKQTNKTEFIKRIIGHLFLQKLSKASLLGLPSSYQTVNYHDIKVHGNVDFNRFINKDIPIKGNISSKTRERLLVPEIMVVLSNALDSIEEIFGTGITGKLSEVRNTLKQETKKTRVTMEIFRRATNHKSLSNPIYASFKSILDYAGILLELDHYDLSGKGNKHAGSYLLNIADLWEVYLEKLLRHTLSADGWTVNAQEELNLYENSFYSRHMYPDLVLRHDDGRVAVFDAKYKRMKFQGKIGISEGDVDRSDFYQIHSYMSFYQKESKDKLVAGGLLYPIDSDWENDWPNKKSPYSEEWFGGKGTFIVDGIANLGKLDEVKQEELSNQEKAFIDRIKNTLSLK